MLGKLPVPGRSTSLLNSRTRAYCACSRCGWALFGHFFSLSYSSFSSSLGDGPIYTEIVSKRAVKSNTTNKPTCHVHMSNASSLQLWCAPVEALLALRGWSGGAMVLGKLPVPGRPTILITVGQGPTALAVGAGGGGLDIFTLIYPFSSFSLSLGDGPI